LGRRAAIEKAHTVMTTFASFASPSSTGAGSPPSGPLGLREVAERLSRDAFSTDFAHRPRRRPHGESSSLGASVVLMLVAIATVLFYLQVRP